MRLKTFLKVVLFHVAALLSAGILFLLLYLSGLLSSLVLFYRGILLIAVTTVILGVTTLLLRYRWRSFLTGRDIVLAVVTFFCVSLLLFTLLPVTIDRSISVFILDYMAEHPHEVMTEQKMEALFVDQYVNENRAMNKRFEEQIASGNIRPVEGGYLISDRGRVAVRLFDAVTRFFSLHQWRFPASPKA